MDINELESYRLSDAVKFHNRLNPVLWATDEHLHPKVRQALLKIADDFREFLGVNDLKIQDITVSGSNAAYNYTDHSDIDLHLVVDMPDDPVYRELFDAKKYQYNDEHNIRIGPYEVELYVQDAAEPHISQGIYSVRDGEWRSVPRRRRADVNDISVRAKYEDLGQRAEAAIESGDLQRIRTVIDAIKNMRRAGLADNGEFGAENLAFKLLRNQGLIDQLYAARGAAEDREMSLLERRKKKKSKSKKRWTWGGFWNPGFGYYGLAGSESGEGSGDGGGGGESMRESPDGVSAGTHMFLSEQEVEGTIKKFIRDTARRLDIKKMPRVFFHRSDAWSKRRHSFGMYDPESHELHVSLANRHLLDILRTTAHELAHCRQHEIDPLPPDAGHTGSPFEDEAHAVAGEIMRDFADAHPELFSQDLREDIMGMVPASTARAIAGMCAAVGLSGCVTTADLRTVQTLGRTVQSMERYGVAGAQEEATQELKNYLRARQGDANAQNQSNLYRLEKQQQQAQPQSGSRPLPSRILSREPQQEDYDPDHPPGPESRPTMPAGTVRVDVSDMYDWYKLGQHISNLKGLGRHDFGQGPPSTIVAFGSEPIEHQYIRDLEKTGLSTTDIDPVDPKQPKGMKRQRVDPTFNVSENASGYIPTRRQARDPRFSMALTVDVQPGEVGRQANKLGLKTDSQGRPDLLIRNLRNALKEFKTTGRLPNTVMESAPLSEINMSPGALKKFAQTNDLAQRVIVGFELEMCFRNLGAGLSYGLEDERVTRGMDLDDLITMFREYVSRSDRGYQRMEDAYRESHWEKVDDNIDQDAVEELAREKARDDIDSDYLEERVKAILNDEPDLDEDVVREAVIENILDANWRDHEDEAREEVEQDVHNNLDYSFGDWLYENFNWLSQVAYEYDLGVPFNDDDDRGEAFDSYAMETAAADLTEMTGLQVDIGSGYHSVRRRPDVIVIEADSSIEPDRGDAAAEVITPPLPLKQSLDLLKTLIAWAKKYGGYSNDSTGLHVNMSIRGAEDIDYVKLMLMIGDQHVLDQFGRLGNHYAMSAVKKLQQSARYKGLVEQQEQTVPEKMLDLMRQGMTKLAAQILQSDVGQGKYTSVHIKPGYVEFRSPGGEYLDRSLDELNSTVLRFARGMAAAADPEDAREEYAKKLYRVLSGYTEATTMKRGSDTRYRTEVEHEQTQDILKLFARYSAGTLSGPELKKEWARTVLDVDQPETRADPKYWTVVDTRTDQVLEKIAADNEGAAAVIFVNRYKDRDNYQYLSLVPPSGQADATSPGKGRRKELAKQISQGPRWWTVRNQVTQDQVLIHARTEADAETRARLQTGWSDRDPVRTRLSTAQEIEDKTSMVPSGGTVQARATPGSPQAAFGNIGGGEFSGQWKIVDSQDRVLHTFGGIGNAQADANRYAAAWLGRNRPDLVGQEVAVWPVMRDAES